MINTNYIHDSIASIHDLLKNLKSFKEYNVEDVENDFHLYASLRYAFIELIERAIDINQHIIKEGGGEAAKDYADSFIALAKIGVIDRTFAETLAQSVGLRNIVVHEYRDIDDARLYQTIDIALDQYPKYCEAVLQYMKRGGEM